MFSTHFVVNWISKTFVLALHSFSAIGQKRRSRKSLSRFFKFGCWPRSSLYKKKDFTNRCRIQFWIDWNQFGIEKIICPFLFVLCRFRHSLIESHFKSSRSKKNSRFRQKGLQNYLQRKILRRKRKKTCFHYIFLSRLLHGYLFQ